MAFFSRIRSVAALAAIVALSGAAPAPAPRDNAISIDSLYCLSIGHGRGECQATVSGASGTVTYTYNPTPFAGSGDFVLVYCTAYRNKKVTLTVTDGSSSDYAETTFYCGNAV
jgi:hypothetical protein